MTEKRYISLDYGEKRIGIAVSDPLGLFAIPLATFPNDEKFITEFTKIIEEYPPIKIILGLPLKEDGTQYRLTEIVKNFGENITNIFKKEIIFIDERYSSGIAKERIIESVKSKKKRRDKGLVDRNAAAVILEDFLGRG